VKKRNNGKSTLRLAKDLWINPRSNIRGPDRNRAWQNSGNISPSSGARFLELADIALGLKKRASSEERASAGARRTPEKSHKTKPPIKESGQVIV
jgi:hypothetical protein